ncbi:hypothetical protein AKUH4B102A_09170 [Apilactobacillus kunkeei]|nr:hypothetical protein AKUH4B102A_09170 [Apilactobacillus kunkeei]
MKDTHAEVQNWLNEQEQGVQNVKDIVNNAIKNAGSDNNGGDSDDNSTTVKKRINQLVDQDNSDGKHFDAYYDAALCSFVTT